MSNETSRTRSGFFLLGLSLALGLIISSVIVSKTLERVKLANEKITVKGFAEQRITSDVAIWQGRITVRAAILGTAYAKLERDMKTVLDYLEAKGIPRDEIDLSVVFTRPEYKNTEKGYRTNEITGYVLEQSVDVTSDNVKMIDRLSKESASLIKQGVEFNSLSPQYYCTKFDDIKITLIGKATRNARERADQFAKNGGITIGTLKSATQGVFQVTPVNSTDVSGYGRYDTTSIEKSAKSVVTVEYSISRD